MRAMVLEKAGSLLVLKDVPCPIPKQHELLIQVKVCGVCRTDLHIIEGDLKSPKLPLILGHQIVGKVVEVGAAVSKVKVGECVGVPWLGGCCTHCEFCLSNRENLCEEGVYTGYIRDGGYAEYCTAHEDFVLKIPSQYEETHAAPLLCAGLIGYRAFRLASPKSSIGFYGFGSSAHILIQIAVKANIEVYVFTRPGDVKTQAFALSLGAKWAGGSDVLPEERLDAAIIFAPVGSLYVQALKAIKKGGRVVSAGICMSDIPSFPYELLFGERSIASVTNLTKQDGIDFMKLINFQKIKTFITIFPLEEANLAIQAIKKGSIGGSVVLKI